MRPITYLAMASVCLGFLLNVQPVAAQPPNTHALIHIANESNAKATVYYKWGNGPWKVFVIQKMQKAYFNYRYNGTSQSSPDFYVRIDVDTDGVKFMEHVLTRGASPDDNSPRYGHHYVIKQLPGTDTRYIQPVTSGAYVRVTDKNSSRP